MMREKSGEENNDLYTIKRVSFRTAEKIRSRAANRYSKNAPLILWIRGAFCIDQVLGFQSLLPTVTYKLYASLRGAPTPLSRC